MKIETLEIHNYKVLQNVKIDNLGSMAVFLGENGVGKTTLFDVFGFIKSCLTENVRSALQARGGYAEVHSRDAHGDISFIVRYKDSSGKPQFIYELHIGLNEKGEPVIACEALYTEDPGKKIFVFQRENDRLNSLYWPEGNLGNVTGDYPPAIGSIELANSDTLALNIFGQMAQYQYAVEFRKFLEDWFVSDFQIDKMKLTQDVSYNESLTRKGDNIANVAQFLFDQHPNRFNKILEKMKKRIPGVTKIEAKTNEEGGILLKFQDGHFKDPFASRYVSDGTIKMFAYLVMLADPNPHMLLCIEEPENQLYPRLLEILAEEFKEYAAAGGQVFISTHSPDLVNALEPGELFFIKKQDSGYSEIKSIGENDLISRLYSAGDKLGYLWKEGLFEDNV